MDEPIFMKFVMVIKSDFRKTIDRSYYFPEIKITVPFSTCFALLEVVSN